MPTYDYRCFTCNITKSLSQGLFDEKHNPDCPACLKPMMRVFNAPSVMFKGSGWGKDS